MSVLEGSPAVDPAPRTLIVTSRLCDVAADLPRDVVVNEIRRIELFSDGHAATIGLRRPDLVIERAAMIRGFAEQAQALGARVLTGHRFRSLDAAASDLQVIVERGDGTSESIRARTVIGADGAFSRVAIAAGWPRVETVPLVQAIVRLPRGLAPDTARVWFVPEDTRYFYWLIPESPTHGVVGLIGEDGRATRVCLERFMGAHGLEPQRFQAARIPLYTGWIESRRFGAAQVHLVGDAAAHVKVTTVGGMVTGLRGAAGVVDQIVSGRRRRLRALRGELDRHLLIRRALHRMDQRDYSRLLELLDPKTVRLLGHHTRDDVHRVLFGLLITEPRLMWLGLRSLLAGQVFGASRSPAV